MWVEPHYYSRNLVALSYDRCFFKHSEALADVYLHGVKAWKSHTDYLFWNVCVKHVFYGWVYRNKMLSDVAIIALTNQPTSICE